MQGTYCAKSEIQAKHIAKPRNLRRREMTLLGAVLSVTGQMEFAGFVDVRVRK